MSNKRMWVQLDDIQVTSTIPKSPQDSPETPYPSHKSETPKDEGYSSLSRPLPVNSTIVSKNSIFDIPQTVNKPATKMTLEELNNLKLGIVNVERKEPLAREQEFITVPVFKQPPSAASDYKNNHTQKDNSSMNLLSYLKDSTFTSSVSPPVADVDKKDALTDALNNLKLENEPNVLMSDSNNLSIFYFPISKHLIGEGRYAKVYHGEYEIKSEQSNSKPHRFECAIKRPYANTEAQSIAFAEIYILKRISHLHPNIINFIGAVDETSVDSAIVNESLLENFKLQKMQRNLVDPMPRLLIILEYLPLGNLWEWLSKNKIYVGSKLFIKWGLQIAGALECIQSQGLIHHDIKPHNILLTDVLDIRISDFGNACFIDGNHQMKLGDALGRGTLAYTAPEIIQGLEYTMAIDVYSFGVTLHTLITGKEPFYSLKSNVQMMMCIKKGFFECGMQSDAFSTKYLNGENVQPEIIDLIHAMVSCLVCDRPTAKDVIKILNKIE